ncbi:hypothetical protein ABMA27_010746 [Loxostege sticticalis]|uniref:Reverse transcriptase n=1 Tax=Loxostege sticticalis TaxID=481309 RepID=A0ABR3H4K3_LOXSC
MKIFANIEGTDNCAVLQNDLNTVVKWCQFNKMKLNVDKCSIISFTKKKNRITHSYIAQDTPLNRNTTVRDLGVLIDEQLTFRQHYEYIMKRSRRLLGFIFRATKDFKNPRSMLSLFLSLVRSILEYCSPIWSPYYNVHIENIEKIQKKCLRYICYKYKFGRTLNNYSDRLSKFGIMSLQTRRARYDLLYLHKILHSSIDAPDLLSSLSINIRYRTRVPKVFTLSVYKNNTSFYSPLVRMCRSYNELVCGSKDTTVDVFNNKCFHL